MDDKVETVKVYALDADGEVDRDAEPEVVPLRTPSFACISEMGVAGVEIWQAMEVGTIVMDRRVVQQAGLGIAALIVDGDDAASAHRDKRVFSTYDWQMAILRHRARMIPDHIADYYRTLNTLLNAAFAGVKAEDDDASGEPSASTTSNGDDG